MRQKQWRVQPSVSLFIPDVKVVPDFFYFAPSSSPFNRKILELIRIIEKQ